MLNVLNSKFALGLLLTLVASAQSSSFVDAAVESSLLLPNNEVQQHDHQQPQLRELQGNNRVNCPPNSVYHCNDPTRFVIVDPTVVCDRETCLWDLSALSPFRPPYICRGIVVQPNTRVFDMLEPCLWWQSLYGTTPIEVEDPQEEPREEPPSAPSVTPPGVVATEAPSPAPVVVESNSTSSTVANSTTTDDEGEEPSTTDDEGEEPSTLKPSPPYGNATLSSPENTSPTTTLEFNTILITYFVTTQAADRRALLRDSHSHDRRSLQSVWKDVDREQLLDLTVVHLLSNIPEALSVVITLTALQEESETTGSIVAATEALKGSVVFDTASMATSDFNSTSALNQRVKRAFQDEEALEEYVTSLESSPDAVLKRTVQVTLGLPRDPSSSNGAGSIRGQQGEGYGQDDQSSLTDFEWNPLWIAILVGGGIGVCGIVTVGFYLVWARRSHHRRVESGVVKASLTGSFTYGDQDEFNNSPHGTNLGASPSNIVVMGRNRSRRSNGSSGRPSSPQSSSLPSSPGRGDSRLLLADMTGASEDAMLNDLRSECTSVYSYIEKSTVAGAESITTMQMMAMMDDASIVTPCPGPSSNYRPRASTEGSDDLVDSNKTTGNRMSLASMWSVMGMGGLDAPSKDAVADPPAQDAGSLDEEKKSDSFDADACTDVGVMEVQDGCGGGSGEDKAARKSNSHLIYSSEKDKNSEQNGIYIFDDDVSVVSAQNGKVSQPTDDPKTDGGQEASPSLKVIGVAASTKWTTGSKASESDNESGVETDDDDSVHRHRLAFCDLSQVAEGSESSSRVSTSSERSGKPDQKLSLEKENALGGLDDSEIESDGEDDSLFMRPDLGSKTDGSFPTAGTTVLLSNENKLSTNKDEFRIGPLLHGSTELTAKEKKHMFLMERTPGGSFDDSSLHSIRLPGNLNVHDFRDDMSLSTTGSNHAKGTFASQASF